MFIEATEQHIARIVELVNFSYRGKDHQGWTSEALIVGGDRCGSGEPNALHLIKPVVRT